MSNGTYVLRPEAGPVKPAWLNRSQRDAFRAIVAALVEANRSAQQKSTAVDPVQRDRVSRLFFVSGQPGSGKTSLYLTLRDIIGQKERLGELREEYNNDKELSESLSDLVDGTRWLEPIDLEVGVDEGENLLGRRACSDLPGNSRTVRLPRRSVETRCNTWKNSLTTLESHGTAT